MTTMNAPLATLLAAENMKDFTTTPYQLRKLVLDYLCDNCYSKTAKAFAQGMAVKHLDADGDEIMEPSVSSDIRANHLADETLRKVELRQEIRLLILSGRIDEAIASIECHFPAVLDTTDDVSVDRAVTESRDIEYASPSSVNAAHLSLNLRILAFTESCRTVPLPYPPTAGPIPGGLPATGHSTSQPHSSSDTLSASSSGGTRNDILYTSDSEDVAQAALLLRAQKLYAYANTLPNPTDRAMFLTELANVGGLLAYKYPEGSPMRMYLSQERREAVADQVNRAILYRLGRPPVSPLELYLRQTWQAWSTLHELRVEFPPEILHQAGVRPSHDGDGMNSGDKDRELSVIPSLDLRSVLDIKP